MASSNDKDAGTMNGSADRRARPDLRDVFEQAYIVAFPLLDPSQNLQGASSAHFLRVVLHDTFPHLHQQDIAILSVSIERVFRERIKSAS